jgi:hypothetical protein
VATGPGYSQYVDHSAEPLYGCFLTIDNKPELIPAAGADLAPTGLTVGGIYYIYAYMNAGVMTLYATGGVPVVDSRNGLKVVTGNPLFTLVGMARVDNGPTWHTQTSILGTLSYFNRKALLATGAPLGGTQSNSTVLFDLAAYAAYAINWADEKIDIGLTGYSTNSVAGAVTNLYLLYDGAAPTSPAAFWAAGANYGGSHAHSYMIAPSEAVLHKYSPGISVSAGIATLQGVMEISTRG